jgi:hypothetical protein
MPWHLFQRRMAVATRLYKDPSPVVRLQALHVEEDSWHVQAMAERLEQIRERRAAPSDSGPHRGRHRRRRH